MSKSMNRSTAAKRAPIRTGWALPLAAAVAFAGACSFPFTTPQRQLDAGETVLQGSLDLPGFGLMPRASGGLTHGVGGGDLGVHLGTSAFTGHAGAHGRVYLDPAVISLQGTVATNLVSFGDLVSSDNFGFFTSTMRIGNLPRPSREGSPQIFYGGFEVTGFIPYRETYEGDFELGSGDFGTLTGGYGGLEHRVSDALHLQAEASVRVLGVGVDDGAALVTGLFYPQVGMNLQYTF